MAKQSFLDVFGELPSALFLRRATSLELPMAMRFRHLERTSKEAVGVYRSAQNYICKFYVILKKYLSWNHMRTIMLGFNILGGNKL